MQPLPAQDLRGNRGTWAVQAHNLPALAVAMQAWPRETYDPDFRGQKLQTWYYDTNSFALRKARVGKDRYLTLRLRSYQMSDDRQTFALSAKTEAEKWRQEVTGWDAERLLDDSATGAALSLLPAHLAARLLEITEGKPLSTVACVFARRYATENETQRMTLDVHIHTDIDKTLPFHVLEYKDTKNEGVPPEVQTIYGLRPIKLSKFLWATEV